jgi:protein-S-isoprenylcysteine O-methyltransferase Ste14
VSVSRIPALVRAVVYATIFISVVLVFLPRQLLRWTGVTQPEELGTPQWFGIALVVIGGLLAIWCVVTFGTIGQGTPAPFDPPRRLVVRGPYRFVRNPMYVGAGTAVGGAALFYTSLPLLGFLVFFLGMMQLFIIYYEEPTLKRMFGPEYIAYIQTVRRWWPRFKR